MRRFAWMATSGLLAVNAMAGVGCASGCGKTAEGASLEDARPSAETPSASNATQQVVAVVGAWIATDVFAYRAGEWTLELTYRNRGTRSEGQEGRLLKGGSPVGGKEKGQTLETAMGLLRFYGTERRQPWDNTGWNFADRRRIKRSGDLPAPPATEP